jgi:hypothetical protein
MSAVVLAFLSIYSPRKYKISTYQRFCQALREPSTFFYVKNLHEQPQREVSLDRGEWHMLWR